MSADLQRQIGSEILMRIANSDQPASFWIQLAEEHSLLEALTFKIFEKILRNNEKNFLNKTCQYFINISPNQLNMGFIMKVVELTYSYNFKMHEFGIEITENQPILNDQAFRESIYYLKTLGVTIALDDFGNGYADIEFLKRHLVDRVKIDQKLLKNAHENEAEKRKLCELLAFAEHHNIELIAEGIETEKDLEFARSINCHGVQGYLLHTPSIFIE